LWGHFSAFLLNELVMLENNINANRQLQLLG
jgi:hypothetical protein